VDRAEAVAHLFLHERKVGTLCATATATATTHTQVSRTRHDTTRTTRVGGGQGPLRTCGVFECDGVEMDGDVGTQVADEVAQDLEAQT
jgi:hypothetical protein